MRKLKILLILLACACLFAFCKKDKTLEVDMGYNYYPVNTGHWVVYDVDSISYNDFTGHIDSFRYQIREIVESVFTDDEGRETQRIERHYRLNDTMQWIIKEVWFGNITPSTAERVEENQRFIKLIFPVKKGAEWNGNAFNTLEAQNYEYLSNDEAYTAGNNSFDSTVTVLQMEEYTLISEDYSVEVYARNVGMIYKKFISLVKQPTGQVIRGIDYSYTLHSYCN